jgi:DNA-binding HxlR family transcriptional regulator
MKPEKNIIQPFLERPDGSVVPVEKALTILGGKWKPLILWYLKGGTQRFSRLTSSIPNITPRMLTKQLRELEKDELVTRKVYAEVPVRVEYSLTEQGLAVIPVLEALNVWGAGYLAGDTGTIPEKIFHHGKKKAKKSRHKK